MENINFTIELKLNQRQIFSIMLALQTIMKMSAPHPELVEITRKFHAQITLTSADQIVKMDLFDITILLVALISFNDTCLHSSFLETICSSIEDVLVAYVNETLMDEINLQILLKESGF